MYINFSLREWKLRTHLSYRGKTQRVVEAESALGSLFISPKSHHVLPMRAPPCPPGKFCLIFISLSSLKFIFFFKIEKKFHCKSKLSLFFKPQVECGAGHYWMTACLEKPGSLSTTHLQVFISTGLQAHFSLLPPLASLSLPYDSCLPWQKERTSQVQNSCTFLGDPHFSCGS
jgi:hypothetical protein